MLLENFALRLSFLMRAGATLSAMKPVSPSAEIHGERPVGGTRIRARLLPSEDGWSLVTLSGRVLVRGQGYRSRRQCLEFARARGILALSR